MGVFVGSVFTFLCSAVVVITVNDGYIGVIAFILNTRQLLLHLITPIQMFGYKNVFTWPHNRLGK